MLYRKIILNNTDLEANYITANNSVTMDHCYICRIIYLKSHLNDKKKSITQKFIGLCLKQKFILEKNVLYTKCNKLIHTDLYNEELATIVLRNKWSVLHRLTVELFTSCSRNTSHRYIVAIAHLFPYLTVTKSPSLINGCRRFY